MRMFRVSIFLLLAAGAACWQAESRAGLEQRLRLRALAAQLEPLGTLHYGETSAHFWGSGHIDTLRFVPGEALRARHGLAPDFALSIPRLRYADWQGERPWPARLRVRFDALALPLPEPWPQTYSGVADWRYHADSGALQMTLALAAPAAVIDARLGFRLPSPERFTQAILTGGRLHYRDQGLAQNHRAALALQRGVDPQSGETAFAAQLADWLSQHGLPPDTALQSALRRFAREPTVLTMHLEPPGSLQPETLSQFAPRDRAAALGLRLEPQ